MIRLLSLIVSFLAVFVAAAGAQVDIADAGESGAGFGGVTSFSSDLNSYGGNVSYTIAGVADIGMSHATVGGSYSGLITSFQATFLPLKTRQPGVGWSLGGLVQYENASIQKYKGINSFAFGPLLTVDIGLSSRTDFQLAGSFTYAENNRSEDGLSVLSVYGGIITKGISSNLYITAGASIPSNDAYTVFGVQLGLFFKTRKPSDKAGPVPAAPEGEGWVN